MFGQALFALVQQNLGLLDGLFAAVQVLTQLRDLGFIKGQQACQALIIQFWVQGAPFADACRKGVLLRLQCLLALLLGLEVGGQLYLRRVHGVQFLVGVGLALARLRDGLLQLLLPVFGAGVIP